MTQIFILATVAIIIVYDIYAYVRWGGSATISTWVTNNSKKYPIIPFLMGVVAGHWFWGN